MPQCVVPQLHQPHGHADRRDAAAAPKVKTVGLCHSVQVCAEDLLKGLDMPYDESVQWKIAGINHQAWLLEIHDKDGNDLYPEIKRRAAARTEKHNDMVRYEIMKRFGYYVTESSEHNAEYMPYFIKKNYPELIDRFNIPLDEYPRRCIKQIADWEERGHELTKNPLLTHTRSREFASYIMEAMETNQPCKIGGNVLNNGLITNLPANACVEVPCLVDKQRRAAVRDRRSAGTVRGDEPDEYQRAAADD